MKAGDLMPIVLGEEIELVYQNVPCTYRHPDGHLCGRTVECGPGYEPATVLCLEHYFLMHEAFFAQVSPQLPEGVFQISNESEIVDDGHTLFVRKFLPLGLIRPWVMKQSLVRQPFGLYIHHTWSPVPSQWRGLSTLDGIANYYVTVRKWPYGVMPHFFSVQATNGMPAGTWVATHFGRNGIHVAGHNSGTIGEENVWNGDLAPFSEDLLKVNAELLSAIREKCGIPIVWASQSLVDGEHFSGIRFHRDEPDANKSCPGTKVLHPMIADIAVRAGGEVDEMADPAVVQLIKEIKVSQVARSVDELIIQRMLDGMIQALLAPANTVNLLNQTLVDVRALYVQRTKQIEEKKAQLKIEYQQGDVV